MRLSYFIIPLTLIVLSCGQEVVYKYVEKEDAGALLFIVEDIAPSANTCSYGGVNVSVGFDTDSDGVLSIGEVTGSKRICKNMAEAMLVAKDEPPGENCEQGGTVVIAGVDSNKNGRLDDLEINSEHYVCNQPNQQPEQGDELIKIETDNENSCSVINVSITNLFSTHVSLELEHNQSVALIAYRENDADIAEKVSVDPFPHKLQVSEKGRFALNVQPNKTGSVDYVYSIKASSDLGSKFYTVAGSCVIEDDSITRIENIIKSNDFYVSSGGEPSTSSYFVCKLNEPCFFGMPFGINQGLYPLEIVLNWGDKVNESRVVVRNLTYEHLFQNIYSTPGIKSLTLKIKPAGEDTYFTGTYPLSVE